jgi:predicted nucleic acid-binding protein
MTTYVDSSALMKRYIDEPDSEDAVALLERDAVLVTSWVTMVEVRRNLSRLLRDRALEQARRQLTIDLDAMALVSVDEATCAAAAQIAESSGVRSLDSIHLATAQRLFLPSLSFVTFDHRQANAARSLGFTVLGS